MTAVVSLRNLVDELQILPNEATAYLNKKTGKVVMLTDDVVTMAEMDDGLDEEELEEVRKVLASDPEYLPLPSKFEIHEYKIMEEFCLSLPDEEISDELLGKIRGSGAFRWFKDTIYEYGIEQDWFKYLDEAYKEIVIAWLDSNGIPYSDDMK